jgi:hypothetical protein
VYYSKTDTERALTVTDAMTHFRPITQHGKRCPALLGFLASLAFCPVPAVAQEAGVTLQGFIFDSSSATPIGDVVLQLDGVALDTRSGADGAFVITDVPPGGHTLMAFKDAFVTKAFEFSVPPNSPSTIDMGVLALARVVVREVTIWGTVSDASSSRPIESVRVAINDTVVAITELDGGFAIKRRVAEGLNRLTVQRIGYETLFQDFDVEPNSVEISLMVTLQPQAARLVDIIVETDRPTFNKKLEGFYQRRQHERGQFLGPEQIARIPASRTSDILRRIPTLTVRPLPGTTEIMLTRCLRYLPRFYLDGVEMNTPDIDLTLSPIDIAAVEVYAGGAQIPLQFNRPAPGRCGVVVIWTK